MKRYAAFFRNLNLGRAGSPTRTQFIAAFESAGGEDVASFQAHGNVLYSARDLRQAQAIAERARARLHQLCGTAEPAFVRELRQLARLVQGAPFAGAPVDDVYQQCVSFLAPRARKTALPLLNAQRTAEVFAFAPGVALSVVRRYGGAPGNVNALLERALGAPCTTRAFSTIERLVHRAAESQALL